MFGASLLLQNEVKTVLRHHLREERLLSAEVCVCVCAHLSVFTHNLIITCIYLLVVGSGLWILVLTLP